MKLILPFLIVILFSYSLSSFLKLKSIESIFFGLILIINSLLILTYIFGLRVAVYIICLVTAFLLITNIIYCIKKKKFASHVIEFFNNPAFVIFVLIISVYSALIYDNHLFSWDDYSHWGLAVKAIYEFDGFNITQGILGPQTLGMPIFNSFIISVAGYKEGYMLCGMWFVYWTALLLPISCMGWKKIKSISVYTIIMYSILILISHEVRPNLYNDAMLSAVAGSLVGYYYINKNKSNNYIYIILAGVLLLPHIKRVVGILFAVFVIVNLLIYSYKKNNINKKNIKLIILSSIFIFYSFIIDFLIKKQYKNIVIKPRIINSHWCHLLNSIINTIKSPIGIILISLILLFIVFYICYKKNKYRKYALGINIIFLFALMGYLFINLDSGSIILINAFIKNICKLKIYDVEAFKIIGVSAIICYLLLYAIQKNKKSFYIKQSFVFVIQGIIYLILLILSYSQFSQYEALKSASLSRYLSSFIFYIFIAAISVLLCKEDLWDNIKCKTISVSILLIFVISTIFPAPLTLFNYERNCIYKYTYNYEAQNFGNNIKKITNKDDKIFVVSQKDDGYRQFLMKYYCLPLTINNKYYSLGPSKYEGDIWSKKITINQFKDYLIENNFTHVFLHTIDDYFIETYGVLFDDKSNIVKGKLFKVNIIN